MVEGRSFLQTQMVSPDPRWVRLWALGLRTEPSGNERIATLAQSSEVVDRHIQWVLLDDTGKAQASGEGSPDLHLVEEVIRKGLKTLPWDTLEALIRAQPDHGEACLAQAEFELALSSRWNFSDARPMARYETQLPKARMALDKLLLIPDWPWQVDLAVPVPEPPRSKSGAPEVKDQIIRDDQGGRTQSESDATAVGDYYAGPAATPPGGTPAASGTEVNPNGPNPVRLATLLLQQSSLLQDRLRRMSEDILSALATDPSNPRLQANLAFMLRILDSEGAEWLMGEIPKVIPLPSHAWPPLPLVHAQADVLRHLGNWTELFNQTQAWSRKEDRLFLDPEIWNRHIYREGTLLAYAAIARSWREGWEILPLALSELRMQSGGHYPELAHLSLRWAHLPDAPSKDREELFRLASLPPVAAPVMPPPLPTWKVEVQKSKDLSYFKEAFDTAPSALQWLPSEYQIIQKPALARTWMVSLGGEPKGGGDSLPIPLALSDFLAAGRPSRLRVASDRVAREPEAIGPRRFRINLLLQRMPCRAMEPLLAEDLSRALLGSALKIEDLDANLWFIEARRAIATLEQHLRRWPLDRERWGALAFWTTFIPSHRGPVDLAEELPGFQQGLPFQLCLPASIHAQVGDQLSKRKAWPALRAWFEPVWEGLLAMGIGPGASPSRALVRELAPTVQLYSRFRLRRSWANGPAKESSGGRAGNGRSGIQNPALA